MHQSNWIWLHRHPPSSSRPCCCVRLNAAAVLGHQGGQPPAAAGLRVRGCCRQGGRGGDAGTRRGPGHAPQDAAWQGPQAVPHHCGAGHPGGWVGGWGRRAAGLLVFVTVCASCMCTCTCKCTQTSASQHTATPCRSMTSTFAPPPPAITQSSPDLFRSICPAACCRWQPPRPPPR
jgi:hypothetical protein